MPFIRAALLFSASAALFAQQVQSPSTFTRVMKNGEEIVTIHNVAYELTGTGIPGRPPDQHLVLRTTTQSEEVIGDIPQEGKITLEAWPLGTPFTQKPLYSVTMNGHTAETHEGAVWFVSRGDVDTEYWSVLKLGTAQHLFDTYTHPLFFTVSRETLTIRYVGLDVPGSDVKDARLKDQHVLGVLAYASEDKVLREALITSDDVKQAVILRGYEDATRTVAQTDLTLTITFTENYPSKPNPVSLKVPIVNDDLDLAHAQLPKGLHITAFRR
ncbi:MAG TPA: hypothetical protein VGN17_11100 [Bryobacteraceae bacterium]|jgi:hypothetical protein